MPGFDIHHMIRLTARALMFAGIVVIFWGLIGAGILLALMHT